jgi:hypothetical protein
MSADPPARDELVSFLKLALLFIVLILGREAGRIYSSYTEVSRLSIIFDVREEDLAGFIREFTSGGDPDLRVGLMLTLPSAQSIEGHVTKVPDYARRWLISVYLSAVVVRQPEVSDVDIRLWVEDELMAEQVFSFPREPVPYKALLKGGEVEFLFTGTVEAHLLWMRMSLPFFTLRYPLVTPPRFEILSSGWVGPDGAPVSEGRVGREVFVSVLFENPTRVHSIWENVTVAIYETVSGEPVDRITKMVGTAPQTAGPYVFPFTPEREGSYSYVIEVSGDVVWEGSASFMAGPDD